MGNIFNNIGDYIDIKPLHCDFAAYICNEDSWRDMISGLKDGDIVSVHRGIGNPDIFNPPVKKDICMVHTCDDISRCEKCSYYDPAHEGSSACTCKTTCNHSVGMTTYKRVYYELISPGHKVISNESRLGRVDADWLEWKYDHGML